MIQFHNTLSGKLEEFKPLHTNEVKMYTCGPTVYDYAHIGNFRAFVFEDLLRRFLEFKGYNVIHVMNLTDVDDKTIAGAAREGKNFNDFTATYIQAFQEDLKTLNILPPTIQPRATREIDCPKGIIELIKTLLDKGAAYESDGSVYYRVAAFPRYGKLSKKKLELNIAGARVDVDQYEKEEGSDFALWKKAKEGEPAWDSLWGKGRPGWHIECSAMSMKYLGETFDIHAGGEDLIFPHHENEIAQSEAATGKPFVKYWLHCKFLLVNGEKMSKSKGNFYTLRDLLVKGYNPLVIRYVLLAAHYRTPLNFTLEGLEDAKNTLSDLLKFYKGILDHENLKRGFNTQDTLKEEMARFQSEVDEALSADLNISNALAALFSFIGKWDKLIRTGKISRKDWEALKHFLKRVIEDILGLHFNLQVPKTIEVLVHQREELRKSKKFTEADKIRKQVEEQGFELLDEMSGTTGIVAKI